MSTALEAFLSSALGSPATLSPTLSLPNRGDWPRQIVAEMATYLWLDRHQMSLSLSLYIVRHSQDENGGNVALCNSVQGPRNQRQKKKLELKRILFVGVDEYHQRGGIT